jgi:AraC family transcriptional regulator, transcriptional activator of pobA
MARLRELRLERAQALLADSDLPIAVVAAAVGFVDPDYFCRVFRRHCAMPPGAWRRSQTARHQRR